GTLIPKAGCAPAGQAATANCAYTYTAKSGDILTVNATDTDNPQNNPACKNIFTVPVAPPENPICQTLNFTHAGQANNNPLIVAGESSGLLAVNPIATD